MKSKHIDTIAEGQKEIREYCRWWEIKPSLITVELRGHWIIDNGDTIFLDAVEISGETFLNGKRYMEIPANIIYSEALKIRPLTEVDASVIIAKYSAVRAMIIVR